MISHHRVPEPDAFLHPHAVRRLDRCPLFYPVLRQGLYQYLEASGLRSVLLPEYLPEGIFDPFHRLGFEIRYYAVGPSLGLSAEDLRAAFARRPDVFVYIHTFGIRHHENLRIVRDLLPQTTLFLEDFAHTVPHAGLRRTGDLCAFSFTKLLGVAEGSLLTIENPRWARECPAADTESHATRVLRTRLTRHLGFESWQARYLGNRYLRAAALRLLAGRHEYYRHLMTHYPAMRSPVSAPSAGVLNRVDFDRVFEKRRRLAEVYLERLDPRLRMDLPRDSFLAQALLAFPILVPNQLRFHRAAWKAGVEGYFLSDRWWFREEPESGPLKHHYLLPLNHSLTEDQVADAARRINSILPARGERPTR